MMGVILAFKTPFGEKIPPLSQFILSSLTPDKQCFVDMNTPWRAVPFLTPLGQDLINTRHFYEREMCQLKWWVSKKCFRKGVD